MEARLNTPARRWAAGGACLALAAGLPGLLDPSWQGVLFFPVAIYVLLAIGLHVVVGLAGLLDLGYVAFYAVGAYTTAKLTTGAGWSAWEALPLAVAVAAAAGVALGAPTLRLRGDYLAIVTLGAGEIARLVAQNSAFLGEARGITGIPHPSGGFALAPYPYYLLTLAAVAVVALGLWRLDRSAVGRAWAALRDDEVAAEAMGVPTFRFKLWAFAIGAGTGGLGGWIYAGRVSFISPDNFPLFFSFTVLACVVLGGLGSVAGAALGAVAVAFLPEYLREAAAGEAITRFLNAVLGARASDITEYRVLLFGLALVAIMIVRPRGLVSPHRRGPSLPTAAEIATEQTARPDPGSSSIRLGSPAACDADPGRAATVAGRPVLEVRGLGVAFGGVVALDGVDLTVAPGEILGVIGPNGAGKTTLFNCVSGLCQPGSGTIAIGGRSVLGRPAHHAVAAGSARTFQNIRLFAEMSVLENVTVAADARLRPGVASALGGTGSARRAERAAVARAGAALAAVGLSHRAAERPGALAYGDQRRLEIARALATDPRLLLLDEPAAGMTRQEKDTLVDLVASLRGQGLAVVLIDHDMAVVMGVCDRVVVLDFGRVIAQGSPAEVQSDPKVLAAYLGVA